MNIYSGVMWCFYSTPHWRFTQSLGWSQLGVSKPDKAIFEQALDMAGCSPSEAAMIGDRLDNDIIPAAELGMVTVWIPNGLSIYHEPSEFRCKPDFIVNNLSGLLRIFE